MTAVKFAPSTTDPGWYVVAFRYDAAVVALLKETVPGSARRWQPTQKKWLCEAFWADLLGSALTRAGHQVVGLMTGQKPPPPPKPPRSETWARQLHSAIRTEQLRSAVHRALSKVLHPDVGGDPVLQQQLNDAFKK